MYDLVINAQEFSRINIVLNNSFGTFLRHLNFLNNRFVANKQREDFYVRDSALAEMCGCTEETIRKYRRFLCLYRLGEVYKKYEQGSFITHYKLNIKIIETFTKEIELFFCSIKKWGRQAWKLAKKFLITLSEKLGLIGKAGGGDHDSFAVRTTIDSRSYIREEVEEIRNNVPCCIPEKEGGGGVTHAQVEISEEAINEVVRLKNFETLPVRNFNPALVKMVESELGKALKDNRISLNQLSLEGRGVALEVLYYASTSKLEPYRAICTAIKIIGKGDWAKPNGMKGVFEKVTDSAKGLFSLAHRDYDLSDNSEKMLKIKQVVLEELAQAGIHNSETDFDQHDRFVSLFEKKVFDKLNNKGGY